MNREALFSDGTEDYRYPAEVKAGEVVHIRFRGMKNELQKVFICFQEQEKEMNLELSDDLFDYYHISMKIRKEKFQYAFKVIGENETLYYDRCGVSDTIREEYMFCIIPGLSTPEWSKGAVMYQILVDRFYNGDKSNDVLTDEYFYIEGHSKHMEDWNEGPSPVSLGEFYGGDLEGVRQKLDYLQELGIEVIYFNPLFVSPSNHKYDIQDYDYIDPHYGKIVLDKGELLAEGECDNTKATRYISRVTAKENLEASNQFFAELVKEIHSRGMKVILDGVFNHCGSFNKWLDREKIYHASGKYEDGAFVSKESPYHTFFHFTDENAWPDNKSYEGWWDYDTLPKLNYEGSQELYDYIIRIAAKWVSPPYCVDGWRLDVAADLGFSPEMNHRFWKDFHRVVKEANPDAIILAEHYGDPKAWLSDGDQWDTVMNYDAFMEPVTWFLTGMEKHSDEYLPEKMGNAKEFEKAMNHYMASFQTSQLQSAMNELSNHDHSRFLTRTSSKVGRIDTHGAKAAEEGIRYGIMKEAVVMQMTWPGAPTVYYGDEAGVCGFTDPDNRRTYPWGNENKELIAFHKSIIGIHKHSAALKTGSVKLLHGSENILVYGRFNMEEKYIVIIHNADHFETLSCDVWSIGISKECELEQIMKTTEESYSTIPCTHEVRDGRITVELEPFSSIILKA